MGSHPKRVPIQERKLKGRTTSKWQLASGGCGGPTPIGVAYLTTPPRPPPKVKNRISLPGFSWGPWFMVLAPSRDQ